MKKRIKVLLTIIILLIIALIILISSSSQIYIDWLWFANLNLSHTFLTMFFSNFFLRVLVGLLFSIAIFINISFTKKPLLEYINVKKESNVESLFGKENEILTRYLNKKKLNYIFILASLILGFLFSSIRQDLWKIVLEYLNQTSFNITDPIFSKDIGFYVFSLPFFNFIKEMGMVLTIISLITVGIIYILGSGINTFNEIKFKLTNRAKNHISILLVLFLILKAWDYRLSMYNLLYSTGGVVFGAGYTDINANLLGLKILFFVAIAIAIFILVNLFRKSSNLLLWGLGFWLLSSFIFGVIYPGFIQRFQVEPNEIARESEFISHNINMTLKAYQLNSITNKEFKVENNLNANILKEKESTIKNIRLWDPRPLLSTYNQLQGLRQYYTFPSIDIDRYLINGEYQQVMLAAREIDQSQLNPQAQNWINQKLKYTHGYGVVMSPVNRVTTEGLPEFLIRDIPPRKSINIELNNPSIYYGERTNEDYVIVNNASQEFHYPMGSENEYYNYDGIGGVQLNSFLRKAIYALRFGNIKFLLSDNIHNKSRIMYYRNIHQRVRKVAPFLRYDSDPYLVISDGRLFWIQDAYTTTDKYPYSQPIANLGNYIRNSIKIVIDAYNGTMDYYVIDKSDPLALTYMKIFPDLFKDGEDIPMDLREHFRYPQDFFEIQANLYSIYHMQNPIVFYNREDLWNIPEENYGGNIVQMEPYYVNMELPGNEENEFILMQPFTPENKNNMVAWMAGRSDGENYGELIVYNFPKDELVYGPMQIESRIEQNADISQLLTLWSQRGSNVIRGDLLVIPINNSILYVEPVYLQAETSKMPELKRVIVAYQDIIVMKESLELAIKAIFDEDEDLIDTNIDIDDIVNSTEYENEGLDIDVKPLSGAMADLATQALELYQSAQENLRAGNWTEYGEDIDLLEEILMKINDID